MKVNIISNGTFEIMTSDRMQQEGNTASVIFQSDTHNLGHKDTQDKPTFHKITGP